MSESDVKQPSHSGEPPPQGPRAASPKGHLHHWRWPLAFLLSVGLISWTAFQIFTRGQAALQYSVQESLDLAASISNKAEVIAEKFQQGTITHTFLASLPSIENSGSGLLELATLDSTERFRTEDKLEIWWDYVSLGTTVSEISVPVTYRYHLKLDGPWDLSVSNQTCLVTAPRIRPTIPPSIHTGRMQKSTKNGWGRFNADDQLEELEKSLTASLVQYADDPARLKLVRDEARRTVAAFVKNWLLKEDQWRDDLFHSVVVSFQGEADNEALETVSLSPVD